jgi:glutathione synthase/RimK-type ligase-like ATP-grasp enzyme
MKRPVIVALTSYFKGNRFLERAHKLGAHVILLTIEKCLQEPWAREYVDELFALPSFKNVRDVLNSVSYLARSRKIDDVVALDDFDVELGAQIREHLRMPGMNVSTAAFYRDKLAMRCGAKEAGIAVPRFTGVFNHDDVKKFLAETPAPWLLKPRSSASAMGIQRHADAAACFAAVEALGDEQSFYVLEQMLPGEMYHVDSLVVDGEVVFCETNKYFRPLWEVWNGGGVFASQTMPREHAESGRLRALNTQVHEAFGLRNGPSHTEFLRHAQTGEFFFIETSARVGGATITDMVEAATEVNLWEEWAKLVVQGSTQYRLPTAAANYGGVVVSLCGAEQPDDSSFNDAEIFYRLKQKNHIGLVVRCPTHGRATELLDRYMHRIEKEFLAVLPPVSEM